MNERRLNADDPKIIKLNKMQKILDDLVEIELDKKLAEKCGLRVEDIAISHLKEASSLISHGLCLLGVENE